MEFAIRFSLSFYLLRLRHQCSVYLYYVYGEFRYISFEKYNKQKILKSMRWNICMNNMLYELIPEHRNNLWLKQALLSCSALYIQICDLIPLISEKIRSKKKYVDSSTHGRTSFLSPAFSQLYSQLITTGQLRSRTRARRWRSVRDYKRAKFYDPLSAHRLLGIPSRSVSRRESSFGRAHYYCNGDESYSHKTRRGII